MANVNCSDVWFNPAHREQPFGPYDGAGSVRLVPIYIVLLSTLSSIFVSKILSLLIFFTRRMCKKLSISPRKPSDPATTNSVAPSSFRIADITGVPVTQRDDNERLEEDLQKRLFQSGPVVLGLQIVLQIALFIFAIVHLIAGGSRDSYTSSSGWSTYELIFARVMNSGILSSMTSLMFMSFWLQLDDGNSVSTKLFLTSVGTFGVLFVCPILTHVLPMMFAYMEITLMFVLAIGFLNAINYFTDCKSLELGHSTSKMTARLCRSLLGFLITVMSLSLISLWMQVMFNYGVLLYSRESYVDVLKVEWNGRVGQCYFADVSNRAQRVENLFSKFSYLW
eukprot:TRINITY_DN2522_c0_g1_i1.p1 TRINITY_DN2522_c0_g1~~TRINITY_DN2522_c0_g1_i1.p1  ORF type:complete len:337 (-),score=66.91 TRINITY_DN2522_c0_g1_i1:5-1015(-)